MWATTIKHKNSLWFDKVVEMTHDFGNNVTVVTNFETGTIRRMHGEIAVSEHELITDTETYTKYLNNINNEVNPIKN